MKIGYCFTGSFCTLKKSVDVFRLLAEEGHEIYPIFSYNVAREDTRFFKAAEFRAIVEEIAPVVDTLAGAEPFGPEIKCDVMIIAPCTGNTISKIACNITDTPVTLAAKAHLRNEKPLLIAPSTNDALGANAKNLGALMARKNIFFVPFSEDNPEKKPRSAVADFSLLKEAVFAAANGIQLQPIIK